MLRPDHNSYADRDTTKGIWEYLYKVRVPYLQSRTLEDIRDHGVVLSGVPEIDRDIQNQWITTMMCVADMVTYYRASVPIRVVSRGDIKEIYESISRHIDAWKDRLQIGLNVGDAPIEDLIALDRFANTVYDEAKYQFTPDIAHSLTGQHFQGLQRINVQNFFSTNPLQHLQSPAETEVYPNRESMGDFFKDRLMNLRRH